MIAVLSEAHPGDLTLRSRAKRGVSKGGQHQDWFPSFETPRGVYPEILEGRGSSG
jgi:hypothetical protein